MVLANVCQEFKHSMLPDNHYCQNYCWDGRKVEMVITYFNWMAMIHCTLKLCECQEQNSSLFFPLVIVVMRLAFFPPFFVSCPSFLVYFFLIIWKKWMQVPYFSTILQWDGIWHNFFKWHILWVLTWSFLSVFELNAF